MESCSQCCPAVAVLMATPFIDMQNRGLEVVRAVTDGHRESCGLSVIFWYRRCESCRNRRGR